MFDPILVVPMTRAPLHTEDHVLRQLDVMHPFHFGQKARPAWLSRAVSR